MSIYGMGYQPTSALVSPMRAINSRDASGMAPLGNNTPYFPPGSKPTGSLDSGPMLQIMTLMVTMMTMLMQKLMPGMGANRDQSTGTNYNIASAASQSGCSTCASGAACSTCNGGGTPIAAQDLAARPVASDGAQLRGVNNGTLQRNLDLISQDPEGAKLIQEAERRGVVIQVGDPGGGPNVQGITRSVGNRSTITVRDPNNIKTIVHELIHAASTEDGNSQTEEGLANVIGKRVEARIRGIRLENPNVTFNNTLPNYQGLQGVNGIRDTLARLGLSA